MKGSDVNRFISFVSVVMFFGALLCADSHGEDQAEKIEFRVGKITDKQYYFEDAKQKIPYSVYIPKSYNPKKKTPLVVALHGWGSHASQIIRYRNFVPHAEKHGYIIFSAQGLNRTGWYGSHGPGGGFFGPRNLGKLSEQDVLNVLKIAEDNLNIDPDRIYLLGHSMGGSGTLHLGMKYPDKWAALAPIAPAIPYTGWMIERMKEIPTIIIHGTNDTVLPVQATRDWVDKMKSYKMDVKYIEEEGGDHVAIAFKYFDEIFKWFDEHKKPRKK